MDAETLREFLTSFVSSVTTAFGLAKVVSVSAIAGSANRLWQFTTLKRAFAVKELPYNDQEQTFALHQAAAFEAKLLGEQRVLGPTPLPNRNGEYVSSLTGSRGEECLVRVHHWFTGVPPDIDDQATLGQAGRTLRTIQTAGEAWSRRPNGSLQAWHKDPNEGLERFLASGYWDGAAGATFRSVITDALVLVRAGELVPDDWIYTHRDHKPENCLIQAGVVAVLDWDECNYCHPRLEAVAAALRWAGSDEPHPARFNAFMSSYNGSDPTIEKLHEQDFAKWIAELLSWFYFQAGRALGEWPETTEPERAVAATLAQDALVTLQSSLAALPHWTRLL